MSRGHRKHKGTDTRECGAREGQLRQASVTRAGLMCAPDRRLSTWAQPSSKGPPTKNTDMMLQSVGTHHRISELERDLSGLHVGCSCLTVSTGTE